MKTISRYIMTLALLLTAVTGAWADGTVTVKELTASEITAWANDENPVTAADLPGFVEATAEQAQSWDGYPTNGIAYLIYGFDNGEMKKITYYSGNAMTPSQDPKTRAGVYGDINRSTPDRYFYVTGIEAPLTVTWNASTKTGTFSMPGSNVVLTPIYAKAATFATTGTEPEVKPQLPEAAEGVIAGTDAPLIKEGTGIVAFAAASNEVTQGTLMYAIGTSATQAPALTAFSATVPTAKTVADAGADVYVWYYIKGADTPDGQQATEENTFNDTEPACLTVQVLSNKFDITFKAANANTIDATQASKGTVTVGGTDKTSDITDGKLQGVKMGSEVKLKAKPGYKFRKVEVKKKGDGPLAAAFKDGAKIKVGYKWNTYNTTYLEFTNSGGTYSLTSVSGNNDGNAFNSSTLTAKDGNVLALDVVCNPGGRSKADDFSAQIEFDATSSTYKYSSKGGYFTGIISVSVNDTDITSHLTEAK